jgi:site-specific DNA-methyltransferase (adenine-specific)
MSVEKGMFSSNRKDWATPQWLFDQLDKEFHFTLDVCATATNAKCEKFYTVFDDGLKQKWEGVCWMNPPYGHEVAQWIAKAYEEANKGATVVALLAARTDTRWFHKYIYQKAEIRFLPGRLYFDDGPGRSPFPSMIVVWPLSRL